MQAAPGPLRPLVVDVTTLLAESGRIAHGTIRVERGIVGALLDMDRPDIEFHRFDRLRQSFVPVHPAALRAAIQRPAAAEARRAPPARKGAAQAASLGKRIERAVRHHLRDRLWREKIALARRLRRFRLPNPSTFLVLGEIRFDLDAFERFAQANDIAFVPTIFDVLPIAFAGHAAPSVVQLRMIEDFERLFRLADICLCISRATDANVARFCELRAMACPHSDVIPLANRLAAPDAIAPADLGVAPGRFVLAVGSVTERKNQRLLVDIWSELAPEIAGNARLVIVGGIEPDSHDLVRTVRAEARLAERITFLENANDATLAWLYAHCRFTAFPSRLEGFGLPVGESLAAGKLCLASSSSAIPEAAQGCAVLIDPDDPAAWRAQIIKFLADDVALAHGEAAVANQFRVTGWPDTAAHILDTLARRGLIASAP